ncbi:MAG TPA: M14 family zinc carboxypeptidase [Solirubrobacterales bacterium]|nr:M14 family zinc carboxypeptidase [Solirubrobacterales bacterium]
MIELVPAGRMSDGAGRKVRFAFVVTLAALAGVGALLWASASPERRLTAQRGPGPGVDALVHRRVALGRSVHGRPIFAVALGDPDAPRKLLVVGAIHGNETAGIAIARDLESSAPPRQSLLWVIRDLNPDGVAASTRQNAHGVDLNRNFPWRWRHLEHRGGLQYSGPRALSEPESRLARALILRIRPRITIWFHQPLGVVDESGGDIRVERRFARIVGLPPTRLRRYPGSAASWQDRRLRGSTAFVVELPPGKPSPSLLTRSTGAIRRLGGAPTAPRQRHF